MNSRYTLVGACALALAALSCGGGDSNTGPTGGGTANTVSVVNNAFSPSAQSVALNGTVTWQWNSGGVAHDILFDDGTTSGTKSSGTYQRTFAAAGSFPYHCTIHGPSMSGTITVGASSGGTGGGSGAGGGSYP